MFNWLMYYPSIINSWGVHVSCYIAPILTVCQFFNFYLLLMCDIIFTHMSRTRIMLYYSYFNCKSVL
jgi:hypothetical protein